jgi:hypothetical protein
MAPGGSLDLLLKSQINVLKNFSAARKVCN